MNSKPVWVTKSIRPSLKIKQTLQNVAATPGLLITHWASKQLLPDPSQGLRLPDWKLLWWKSEQASLRHFLPDTRTALTSLNSAL